MQVQQKGQSQHSSPQTHPSQHPQPPPPHNPQPNIILTRQQLQQSGQHQQQIQNNKTDNNLLNTHTQSQKQVDVYFRGLQGKTRNISKRSVSNLGAFVEEAIFEGICHGHVSVSKEKGSIGQILSEAMFKERSAKEQRIRKQEEEEQRKRMLIDMHLKYLDSQISGPKRLRDSSVEESNEFMQQASHAILSKKQHQQLVQKFSKQREQFQVKKKQHQQRQKQKSAQHQLQKQKQEQQNLQNQKQQKKKRILQKLEHQKQQNQQKQKEEQENNRRLSEIKTKKFLHHKLEEKYNVEILIPILEEKKKKLREIREISKNFNIQDINLHQREYIKKREHCLSVSQAKRAGEDWQYKAPERSQRMAKILEEESLQAKLKLEEKKRKLDEKIQKQQQFVVYLKQKFPPTIDQKKREQIQQRIRLKSQSQQDKPDSKIIGLNYLQQIKNQRKKSAISQLNFQRKQAPTPNQQQNKKSQTNYLRTRRTKQYEEIRQRRIQKLINSDTTDRQEKIMKLQIQAARLLEEQKRKEEKLKIMKGKSRGGNFDLYEKEDVESTNLLLTSIKAKMGIIQLYNKE